MSGSAPAAPDSFDAFLARGIGPKVGLWRVPMPTESYPIASKPLSSERLINLYVESEPSTAHSDAALISTGGLAANIPLGSFGAGPIIAMNADLHWYVLSGSHFYRVSGDGVTVTDLGSVGTIVYDGEESRSTMMETIAVGITDVVVCVPPNAFTCTHTAVTLTPLAGVSAFPAAGARWVAYLGGYFIYGAVDQFDGFFISNLADPLTYEAFPLNAASVDGGPNSLRRGFIVNRELWLVGEGGIEIWYQLPSPSPADFPFARQPGSFIADGPRSVQSCAVSRDAAGKESFWWVGLSGKAFRSLGYTAQRVSSHGIETVIKATGTVNISRAFCFSQNGHDFYCLTIAGGSGQSLVYDRTTNRWANRQSSGSGLGTWLPSCAIQLGQEAIFGDSSAGNTFQLVPVNGDDNGVPLLRRMTLPPLWSRGSRAFCDRMEIEMEVGGALSPGDVTVVWSDDGGIFYAGGPRTMNTGTILETRKRLYTTRLGSYRQRVFQISFFGHGTVYGVDLDLKQPMAGG